MEIFLSEVFIASVTSLRFVSNGTDATVTLTRRVEVSLAHILFGRLRWGTARECLEISWNVSFLRKLGQNCKALKQDGPELD